MNKHFLADHHEFSPDGMKIGGIPDFMMDGVFIKRQSGIYSYCEAIIKDVCELYGIKLKYKDITKIVNIGENMSDFKIEVFQYMFENPTHTELFKEKVLLHSFVPCVSVSYETPVKRIIIKTEV